MSKFVSDSVEVLLPYSVITPEYGMEDIEHKSIITGKRNYIRAKDRTDYLITDYLFKYGDREARLNYLKSFENQVVQLYPNNETLTNAWNEQAGFYVEVVEPYYLDSTTRYGACNIVLRAIEEQTKTPLTGYGFNYGEM